jgi:hypothetical protein
MTLESNTPPAFWIKTFFHCTSLWSRKVVGTGEGTWEIRSLSLPESPHQVRDSLCLALLQYSLIHSYTSADSLVLHFAELHKNLHCGWWLVFEGVPMDIFILSNGAVMSYIQDVGLDAQLPVLPADVDYIELRWTASEQVRTITWYASIVSGVASYVNRQENWYYLNLHMQPLVALKFTSLVILAVSFFGLNGKRRKGNIFNQLRKRCKVHES